MSKHKTIIDIEQNERNLSTVIKKWNQEDKIINAIKIPDFEVKSNNDKVQKDDELYILKSFIFKIDTNIEIISVREKPDFELSYNGKKIGIELTSIININEALVFQKKLFEKVQKRVQENQPEFKYFIYCYIDKNIIITRDTLNEHCDVLYDILIKTLSNKLEYGVPIYFDSESYLDYITVFQNTKSFYLSTGCSVDYANDITVKDVNNTISIKSKKINEYDSKYDENWLLIKIGSEFIEGNLHIPDDQADLIKNLIDNNFDKIYLYHLNDIYCLQ